MVTSVNTIHEIVKWAKGLPEWQSDALRRLFINGELSKEEKLEVINLAKQANGLSPSVIPPAAIPFTASHAPGQSSSADVAFLKKIRDLKNVNALAGEQALTFGRKGVTVVYGDNGTGKSGYSRLLKRACRARHTEAILPNIHSTSSLPCIPEAIFDIEKSGIDESLTWKEGSVTPESLAQIAVFDTHCVRVFVDDANAVNFMPYGLDVFPKFADLFDDLREQLISERAHLLHRDEILVELEGEHEVGKLIATLSSKTIVSKIEILTKITEDEEKKLVKIDAAVKDLQANDPQKQAIEIRRTKARIEQYKELLQSNYKVIDSDAVSKLKAAWDTAKTKAEVAKLASSSQFSEEPLAGVGSDAWKEMYEHAREYSVKEAYPDKDYPVIDEDSHCPLCMQELSDDAKDRLLRFEKYVADRTEKEAADAKNSLVTLFRPIKELSIAKVDESLLSEIRDISDETAGLLVSAEKTINEVKDTIVLAVKNEVWESVKQINDDLLHRLKTISDDLEEKAKNKDKLVNPAKQKQLYQEYDELVARKKLATHKATILNCIERFKDTDILEKIIESLNSRKVSAKASKLSELILTSELKAAIDLELSGLNINHIEFGLKSSSPKGNTKHQLVIANTKNSNKLTNILSEGEQRVIAIASFLGELGLSPMKTGIVFDDPVSSLDHKWSERISERLVKEGSVRQVIIFTHNISFLLALYKHAAKHKISISSQYLRRILKESGQCNDDLPWAARNASKRKERITVMANEARAAYKLDPDSDEYHDLHDKFNSHLRSTWERTVEEILLNNVVMRFDSGVSTQLLNAVIVDDDDYRDVYHAMSSSSEGINAHDHAASQHEQLMTPDEMDAELAKLKEFKTRVKAKQKETIQRRKESVKTHTH